MAPDSPTFFVDYELSFDEVGTPVVSFAFRVGEHVLGDLDVELAVRSVRDALVPILRHEGDRRDDGLHQSPLEVALRRLEIGVLVYADPGLDSGSDWKRFLRFVVLPRQLSTFRGWSAYLLEDADGARLIWRDPGRAEPFEARLALGELEAALRSFHAELESQLDHPQSLVPHSGERRRSELLSPPSVRARGGGRR